MDLTKYRKPKPGQEKPAAPVVASKPNPPSSLYSSLGCLGSPFLLQNLLMQQMSPAPVVGQPAGIPLMAGQIVAALNSLLFTLHGLQDKGVEMNVQGQLSAIYTRLQEIVTMIEHAKKEPVCAAPSKDPVPVPSQSELHKQLELVTSTKEAEEQRIGAQLEEYQRAMAATTSAQRFPQYPAASATSPLSSSGPKKQQKPAEVTESKVKTVEAQEAATRTEPASEVRRVSRDSTDEGPAEKRVRVEEVSSPASSPPSASRGGRSGKGGKGIRNRVFCGDCAGCLKNDDCGSCRYCRDKTKFGGQNRLRQKCLHRRCLLDTHRRNGGSGGPASTSEQGIYSGLELARLQHNSSGDHSIFSLLGGSTGRVPTLHR